MKKTFIVLQMVLLSAMLMVSCDGNTASTSCTVTFDLNGGTGTGCDLQMIAPGKTANKPEKDPKKTNAVFKFWSKDKTSEFKFDTAITEDTTLYAVWKTEFEVGDTGPAGGKIFYVATTEQTSSYVGTDGNTVEYKWRYLEASPEDVKIGDTSQLGFYYFRKDDNTVVAVSNNNDSNSAPSSTGNAAIGQGRYNSSVFYNWDESNVSSTNDQMVSVTEYAVAACKAYRGGGFDDWFIPSFEELKTMFSALNANTSVSFSDGKYWSSTEYNMNFVWARDKNGSNDWNDRKAKLNVRAVRAF